MRPDRCAVITGQGGQLYRPHRNLFARFARAFIAQGILFVVNAAFPITSRERIRAWSARDYEATCVGYKTQELRLVRKICQHENGDGSAYNDRFERDHGERLP